MKIEFYFDAITEETVAQTGAGNWAYVRINAGGKPKLRYESFVPDEKQTAYLRGCGAKFPDRDWETKFNFHNGIY